MRKLIYVAHPYGGEKRNLELLKMKIAKLSSAHTYVSPLHAFGFMYDSVSYFDGMDMCLDLLDRCDAAYFCKGWENSKGCCIEMAYCRRNGIEIIFEEDELGAKIKPEIPGLSFGGFKAIPINLSGVDKPTSLTDILHRIMKEIGESN